MGNIIAQSVSHPCHRRYKQPNYPVFSNGEKKWSSIFADNMLKQQEEMGKITILAMLFSVMVKAGLCCGQVNYFLA